MGNCCVASKSTPDRYQGPALASRMSYEALKASLIPPKSNQGHISYRSEESIALLSQFGFVNPC